MKATPHRDSLWHGRMIRLFKQGVAPATLAERFGVTRQTIYNILTAHGLSAQKAEKRTP